MTWERSSAVTAHRAKALLDKNPDPTEAEIRAGISNNLCRCTGYVKIVRAIQLAASRMQKEGK